MNVIVIAFVFIWRLPNIGYKGIQHTIIDWLAYQV